jgi:tetratricopeptide (TPR) repeat protein
MLRNYKTNLLSVLFTGPPAVLLFASLSLTGCSGKIADFQVPKLGTASSSQEPEQASSDSKPLGQWQSLSAQANALERKEEYSKAIPLLKKAINIKKAEKPDESLAYLYGNLGWVYATMKNYKEAVEVYSQALKCSAPNSPQAKGFQRDLEDARAKLPNGHPEKHKSVH